MTITIGQNDECCERASLVSTPKLQGCRNDGDDYDQVVEEPSETTNTKRASETTSLRLLPASSKLDTSTKLVDDHQQLKRRVSVFISYSRSDWDSFVSSLVENLRSTNLFDVWVDQHLLLGGDDWMDSIGKALDDCNALILVMSPNALASKFVKMEYRYFFSSGKPLIPILYKKVDKFPPELSMLQHIDFTEHSNLKESQEHLHRILLKTSDAGSSLNPDNEAHDTNRRMFRLPRNTIWLFVAFLGLVGMLLLIAITVPFMLDELNMRRNNNRGVGEGTALSTQLSDLQHLMVLLLDHNNLTGEIPTGILDKLPSDLKLSSLGDNDDNYDIQLLGDKAIPTELGQKMTQILSEQAISDNNQVPGTIIHNEL